MNVRHVIDVTRPFEYLAVCPRCGHQVHLPESWQALMRDSLRGNQALTWDGTLGCRNGHPPGTMTVVPIVNYPRPEPDGTYLVHLVTDDDRRALCTGEPWAGVPPDVAYGTHLLQCKACHRLASALTTTAERVGRPVDTAGHPVAAGA